ncbi:MAG: U32 family peptidase [Methanospirillum sp.]|uniref:peptidase U32 family protein n=1 Tax=Methanospirillum sp. TaxID=45200 RepID=UPI0023699E79|nr:U32 family peptidase [Methanospirillum sp.]MDD1729876.1 U32 family peptidase [Methanospirillum sp.]
MMELLAPAGTPEAFKVAVAAGADAVYLGGSRFGARHFAGNFTDSDLEEAVSYAHLRGVKVYVTVNILVHDYELPEVLEYLLFLSSLGIDAVLIQDLGVLSLAQKLFSHLSGFPALHASTQMAVHNREGAEFARKQGCVRIVLARELPTREVSDIADSLRDQGCEIEIFGHGALCYGYSGQCLLSAVIGGRSGNRGMCAQPCRKPYSLVMGKRDTYGRMSNPRSLSLTDHYLLSTRDLSIYPVMKSIASLPIAAIKIEGRMRSPQYVATTVSIYRRALDAIKAGTFSPVSDDEIDLAIAFSRGFTAGYLNGESYLTVMGRDQPGRRGLLVGTVTGFTPDGLMILDPYCNLVPERGDGLVCLGRTGDQGFVLRHDSRIQKKKLYLNSGVSCHVGDQVYLTSRKRNSQVLDHLTQDPDQRFYGSIALALTVTISTDGSVDVSGSLEPRSGMSLPLSYRSEAQLSPARSRPLRTEQIRDALQKMGGTLFSLRHLEIICPDNLFAPVSVLNGIRREILSVAEHIIIESFRPAPEVLAGLQDTVETCRAMVTTRKVSSSNHHDPMHLIVLVSDTESAIAALSAGALRVYIEWYPHQDQESDTRILDEIRTLVLLAPNRSEQVGIKIPKILHRSEMDRVMAAVPEIC